MCNSLPANARYPDSENSPLLVSTLAKPADDSER